MLSGSSGSNNTKHDQPGKVMDPSRNRHYKFEPTLEGRADEDGGGGGDGGKKKKTENGRSALEMAVGRKDRSQNLSYQQQIERFPQLKNATVAQSLKNAAAAKMTQQQNTTATPDGNNEPMMVQLKPLGVQIQHV